MRPRSRSGTTTRAANRGWAAERAATKTDRAKGSAKLRGPLESDSQRDPPLRAARARGNARSHEAAGHDSFSRALGAATGDTRACTRLGGGNARARDARATGRACRRGATVARAHDRIPFRARRNGRDTPRVGGKRAIASTWPMNERAGAAVARAARGATRKTPAASDVTARGRGKRAAAQSEPTGTGGRAVAAPFLRPGRARFAAPLCKNGDATRGPRAPHTVDRAKGVQGALRVR